MKPLYLAHPLLPQVDLRKGKERARCYPVSGAGPHGWCYVDSMKESQDSYKKVGIDSKKIFQFELLDRTGASAATTAI